MVCEVDPIGEGKLLFSPECGAVGGRIKLADKKRIANINALRMQKSHEGKGHISNLVQHMEQYAIQNGYVYLTIGVEAKETRNLAIIFSGGTQNL